MNLNYRSIPECGTWHGNRFRWAADQIGPKSAPIAPVKRASCWPEIASHLNQLSVDIGASNKKRRDWGGRKEGRGRRRDWNNRSWNSHPIKWRCAWEQILGLNESWTSWHWDIGSEGRKKEEIKNRHRAEDIRMSRDFDSIASPVKV